MIRPEDQRLLQPSLLPGERLLWAGRPQRGIQLRWADLYLLPFSLVWGGFAIVWNVIAWTSGAPVFFALIGLPFLVVGLYLIAGRFIHEALVRSSLLYAVTSHRVIVLRNRFGRSLRSAELGYLPMLNLDEHSGGRGTLRFDSDPVRDVFGRSGWGRWVTAAGRSLSFERIEQPRLVYDLIRREIDRRRIEAFGEPQSTRAFIG
jgi:hypothetical protein